VSGCKGGRVHQTLSSFKLLDQEWVVDVFLYHVVVDKGSILGADSVVCTIVHLVDD